MREDEVAKRLKDAIRRKSETPTKDRFQEMVRDGVIDSEGRVLLRMPLPPKRRNKKTK
jgi:hypothetical protein